MSKLKHFCLAVCLILTIDLSGAMAQPVSQDAEDWEWLRGQRNIFALREALETNLPVSDGVRALGIAYVSASLRDFRAAYEYVGYARNYAQARQDADFMQVVTDIEQTVMREQGRFQALAAHLSRGPETGSVWQRMVSFRAETLTSSYLKAPEFKLKNISPDDGRLIVPAQIGGAAGTLLFDTGAESTLLSDTYAEESGAERSGITFNMLTVDGPRITELARLDSLGLGAARFGGVTIGVQKQRDGVIGFFLNEGATGILGFPLLSRFGEMQFHVTGERIEHVTLRRPAGQGDHLSDRPNVMIREDKPYLHISLDGQTYSCIFDTGAPRSVFSSVIIARHENSLSLETLTLRETKRAGLLWQEGRRIDYVKSIPVRVGHREVSLQNVQVLEGGGPAADFCVIGLDAVIASGGARLSLDNLQFYLGENNRLSSQLYNLR